MSYPHGYWELIPFLTFNFLFFPHFSIYVAVDIPNNVDVFTVAAQVHCGDEFRGSNSVEIMNGSGLRLLQDEVPSNLLLCCRVSPAR